MKTKQNETLIDVREMQPRDRHPAIFNTWAQLKDGASLLLVNDHEPLPLFYQLSCEHTGTFRWEYVEQGPKTWQVRLTKGNFSSPGYTPPKKTASTVGVSDPTKPNIVDVRPVFARGEAPCAIIDEAADTTPPGGSFVLLAPFEPMPLYTKLGRQGFTHQATPLDDGGFRVEFKKAK